MKKKEKSKLSAILIVPDVHVPYHDRRAWELMLSVAKEIKPENIVILGDFADFFSISSYSKDPNRALQLDKEMLQVNAELDRLDALGAKHKMFISGNHEDRLERYLKDKAPELFNFISIAKLLKLEQRGWEHTPYKSDCRLGKLYLTHDVGNAGRTAIFKALEMYQHSNVTAHTHRLAYIVEGDVTGNSKVAASFGWLGSVKDVDYMHQAKAKKEWALGFGLGYLEHSSGVVYLNPIPIVDYTCVVNGKLYRG